MSKPLSDRIALVTGASRGIGAALALQLAQAGAHVVAVARTVGGLEELDDKIKAAGGTATLVPLDMKDSDGIARLALALNERYGRLDVLVGNAGMLGPLSPLGHIEPKDWDNLFAVNVTANWQLIRTMDPLLKARAGRPRRVHDIGGRAAWRAPIAAPMPRRKPRSTRWCAPTRPNARPPMCASICSTRGRRARACMRAPFPASIRRRCRRRKTSPKAIVPLCLPSCAENGKIYDFRAGKFLEFRAAGVMPAQCLRLARPLNGLSFSRSVRRIGVPGSSKLSRSELTR